MKRPGYALIISRDGKTLYQECNSFADIENNQLITPKTKFRLASLTKPFTALLILKMIDNKLFGLDDTLNNFFPEFPDWKKDVSVKSLLNHTSGLKDYEKVLVKNNYKKGSEPTNSSVVQTISNFDCLLFKPGEMQLYSESGYVLLAAIAERILGDRYSNIVKKQIFEPLKMNDTLVVDKPNMSFSNRAIGYKQKNGNYVSLDYNPLNFIVGNEGIYSTINDLGKFSTAWFTNNIISKKSFEQTFTKTILTNGYVADRGFCFTIDSFNKNKIIYHGGNWVGFRCMMILFPELHLSGYLLANSTDYDKESKRLLLLLNKLSKYLK